MLADPAVADLQTADDTITSRTVVRTPAPQRSTRAMQWLGAQVLMLGAGLAASIPVIASTVNAVHSGWQPAADRAIIASRAWDVLSTHTPLVGQFSESGGVTGHLTYSLGPMLYWLLALPARFGDAASLPVTMGVMNVLAILGTVGLARRRGGIPLMLGTALAVALMCQSLPTESFHDMWNPSAGLFPLLLQMFVCWSIACGDYKLLPLMALLASWLIEVHLMYIAPTLALMAVAIGGLAVSRVAARRRVRRDARRQADAPAPRRAGAANGAVGSGAVPGAVGPGDGYHRAAAAARPARWPVLPWALLALVVALVCWSAPIVDELSNDPGNISAVVQTATRNLPTVGSSYGWHAVVRAVGITPWWLYVPATRWNRQYDVAKTPSALRVDTTLAALAALALVGLIGLIRRRGDIAAAALIGLVLSAALAAQVAATPTVPLLEATLGYTTWWGSQLGMWIWLMLAWATCLGLAGLARWVYMVIDSRRTARPAGGVAAGLPSGRSEGERDRGWPVASDDPTAVTLGARVVAAARRAPRRARGLTLAGFVAGMVCVTGITLVGSAVASTGKPDEHVKEYKPIAQMTAALERIIPPGQTINLKQGTEDWATMPIKPGLRYWLVRHGDRVLAVGSYERLGDWYELLNRPYTWIVEVTDGLRPPARHMQLAVRVHFVDGWGPETYSAWVRHVAQPAANASVLLPLLKSN